MPQTSTRTPAAEQIGRLVRANLSNAELYEHAIRAGEGVIAAEGPIVVRTGKHTGRSPKDKYIVRDAVTESRVWWGDVNQPTTPEQYEGLRARVLAHLADKEIYAQDLFIGADSAHRRMLRVYTESAWASVFARNLFRRPTLDELETFQANFTIIDAPSFKADPSVDGTRSETAIFVNLAKAEIVIVGTAYAGEIKKSAFTFMNYLMPEEGVFPMHCSVNVGQQGDSAIFFGLSGTGKTTLSSDPERMLIGDDEHGWGDNGLFNFEGGCYAKMIKLSPVYEPEIFSTTRRFGTVLENVVVDEHTRHLDLNSDEITENTRGAYPLHFIANASETGMAPQPRAVVFLTADAFGVLPPISRLTHEQAMYHFISGYTAKVAGTEMGIKEPSATFSACFGAPFMPRHPGVYAEMLGDRLAQVDIPVWLVNTGWTGGPYGVGSRMNIAYTRSMVHAALSGKLDNVPTVTHPIFGVAIPTSCPEVPSAILDPRSTWQDTDAYDHQARELARMFARNFADYSDGVSDAVRRAGPHVD